MTIKKTHGPVSVAADLGTLPPYALLKARARAAAVPAGSTLIDRLSASEFAEGVTGDITVGETKKSAD